MKNITHTHTCKDCANFIVHYIKRHNVSMHKLDSGHCTRAKQLKRQQGNQTACARFMPRDVLEENKSQSDSLRNLLTKIHKNLDDILEVIQAE